MRAWLWSFGGAVLCAGGVWAAAEVLAAREGESIRGCIYAGGAAGGALALAGLPFALILVRIGGAHGSRDDDAAFWKWWGGGLLLRMALLGVLAYGLHTWYGPGGFPAAGLTMIAVYLVGLFSEVAWLARVLSRAGPRATEKEA